MNLRRHQNTTPTLARRASLPSSPLSVTALAVAREVCEDPNRRGKGGRVADRSQTA